MVSMKAGVSLQGASGLFSFPPRRNRLRAKLNGANMKYDWSKAHPVDARSFGYEKSVELVQVFGKGDIQDGQILLREQYDAVCEALRDPEAAAQGLKALADEYLALCADFREKARKIRSQLFDAKSALYEVPGYRVRILDGFDKDASVSLHSRPIVEVLKIL